MTLGLFLVAGRPFQDLRRLGGAGELGRPFCPNLGRSGAGKIGNCGFPARRQRPAAEEKGTWAFAGNYTGRKACNIPPLWVD